MDLFKSGQPIEIVESDEKLISTLYEIVKQIDDTATIQLVIKKHLIQLLPEGNLTKIICNQRKISS